MAVLRLLLILGLVLGLGACTRPQVDLTSKVRLQAPKNGLFGKVASLSEPLPTNKKACYGVHVSGPGIPMSQTSGCVSLGIVGGFVQDGGVIVLDIPKGDQRVFELFVHLVEPTESCPDFNAGFVTASNAQKTYRSGVTSNVTLDQSEQTVNIALNFPGESQSLAQSGAAACVAPSAGLKGVLYSDGSAEDSNGMAIPSLSHPTLESFYMTPISDTLGIGYITSGGVLNFSMASSFSINPEIHSVTRKPDTGLYYGLLHSGDIVQIYPLSNSSSYGLLTGATCPFTVTDCKVPVWMQSISAGYGQDLFGLDHSGQIYKLSGTVPELTGAVVSPAVTQVSYY